MSVSTSTRRIPSWKRRIAARKRFRGSARDGVPTGAVLDSLAAHIVVLDRTGRIVATNRAWDQFAAENGGDPGVHGVGGDYLAVCRAAAESGDTDAQAALVGIEAVLAGISDSFTLEYPCHSPHQQRWFALSATPLTGTRGGAVVSHSDITARVQAQEAMHASEDRARVSEAWAGVVFEHAAVGMSIESLSGSFLAVNDHLCRLLGYSREELLSLDWVAVTHPDDRASGEDAAINLAADPSAVYSADKRYLRKDGSVLWAHLTLSVVCDAVGAPARHLAVVEDISARVAAESALRASEERYRQVEIHAPTGLALQDLDGRYLRVNPALCALLGYTEEELLSLSFRDVTHPEHIDADLRQLRRMLAGETATSQVEKRYIRKDGTALWVLLSVALVRDGEGRPAYFIAQTQDIGARKAAERAMARELAAAEELARMRSDFVAAVSHELRTPLTSIVGFAELLQARWDQFSEARRLERIGQIVQAANRQKRLVEDLLLVGRLETTGLTITPAAAGLAALVGQAAEEVRAAYPGQAIAVEGSAEVQVWADATRVAQVLANLIDNAAKYSPEGSHIAVTWEHEGKMVAVRVRDQGPGIPDDSRERLFTRFGRLPGSKTRAGRVGTGLGLYLSRGLAEAMGGTLDLESTGAGGSIFRLRLPAVPSP